MANKIVNRVKMTVSGSPGSGIITLGSAVSGFQNLAGAGVSNGDTVPYVIEDGSSWELGVGTIAVSGSTYTLSRSVTASSNSGSPIAADSSSLVFVTPLAADLQSGTSANNLVRLDGSAKLPAVDGSALTGLSASNLSTGTVSSSLLPTPTSTTLGGVKAKAALANYFLTAIGTDGSVSYAQPAFTDISGTATASQGGTGQSSYTIGDILYASTTSALSKLAGVGTGKALISGGVGTAPSWGSIGLTTHVTGTLPVANGGTGITAFGTGVATALGNNTNAASGLAVLNSSGSLAVGQGGTGLTSLTAGYIPYGNGSGALGNSANFVFDGANNYLTVGNSSGAGSSQITAYGASNGQIAVQNSTNWSRLLQNSNDLYIDNGVGGSGGNIIFRQGSGTTERMRITSTCLLYTSPSPRDRTRSRMPSSA